MELKNQTHQPVILDLIQDLQRLPLLLLNNLRGRSRIKYGMTALFNNGGFTLIELLVVVLIIGILAAVAVPQYQVAVAKSHLSKYMLLVKSFVAAEEAYYLANGEYTDDMPALDVALPTQGECTYNRTGWGNYYTCMDFSIGIYNDATNVQVNTHNMAYMHFFKDFTSSSTNLEYKKGDIVCFSNESIGRQVCKTLGPGTEYNNETKAWKWEYILSR